MKDAIRKHHTQFDYTKKAYSVCGILLFEMRSNTGYSIGEPQRIDAYHMEEIPTKMLRKTAYEIKVSRSDFLSEIRNPIKRRYALRVSNLFYFVTPPGVAKVDEIPQECGLVEVSGGEWKVVVPAPWREAMPPTWPLIVSIARAIGKAKEDSHAD